MPDHTIAENLARLQAARTAIGAAITAKGGTVDSGDGFEEFPADIAAIPSGGGGTRSNVNFYDYDGTIVKSYTKQEFLALESMPANPTHEGLTAQGWNWELADAKTYVAANDKLDIGQMYITSDGKTRIYVHMEDGRLNPELNLTFAEAGSFTVDWGDGTTPDTISGDADSLGTIVHTYAAPGDYVIAVTVNSGKVSIVGTRGYIQLFKKADTTNFENFVYSNCIRELKLGSGVTSIGEYAFSNCYSLTSITIPSGVTSFGNRPFPNCYSLTSITIPSGVTSFGNSFFNNCYSLTSIMIPSGVTSFGTSVFSNCYSLTSIMIPSGVTSIVDQTFNNCYSLTSITIPSGVTSIKTSAFSNCYSLTSIVIPSGVKSFGTNAFQYCYGLGYIKFTSNMPPTAGSNTFTGIPTDCIIYVPAGKLAAYTAKQNYPSSSTYTYREYTAA